MRSIVIPLHRSCGASNDESTRQSHGHSVNQAEPRQFSQSDRASATNQPISLISQSHDQSVKQPSSQAHIATANQANQHEPRPISQSSQSAWATEPRPFSQSANQAAPRPFNQSAKATANQPEPRSHGQCHSTGTVNFVVCLLTSPTDGKRVYRYKYLLFYY